MEQRQAKLIDLNEWERSGGGGNGWSYINRNDSSIMLKLNKEEISEEISCREYQISAALYEMGISCPRVFDFVTDGTRYGMTVERIQGKKSYVRMIADNPGLLEPLAKDFAVQPIILSCFIRLKWILITDTSSLPAHSNLKYLNNESYISAINES